MKIKKKKKKKILNNVTLYVSIKFPLKIIYWKYIENRLIYIIKFNSHKKLPQLVKNELGSIIVISQ